MSRNSLHSSSHPFFSEGAAMSSHAPQPSPSLDVVLTLIDTHAAFDRAMVWDAVRGATAPFDTNQLQLEIDAADTVVRVHAFNLLQLVEGNPEWINTVLGPFISELLADTMPGTGASDGLLRPDADLATHWATN